MMQIVKISVGPVARFKHFQLHKCRDHLDVIWGKPVKDGGALAKKVTPRQWKSRPVLR